jgi:hypothetical protein
LILEGSLRDYITDEEKRQFLPLLCALQKLFRTRSTLPWQNGECRASAGLFGRAISEVHSRAQAQIDDVIIRQLFMGIGAAGELSRPNLFGGTVQRK